MKTACHGCRADVPTIGPDGRPRKRQVAGDGSVAEHVATVGGYTAVVEKKCDVCDGTGWLDGFVPPC
ncbi:hypothetical protein [Amycolatopsis sp. CA-230715]|uniref:hypothetical protein n=1 Tax=Amycolatopsis sp. CA-230715 TaxID=2745196 RepID=UPI001C02B259|nr:hypothetical protein [Amycolatopsis sp. CA-230715]